VSGMKVLWTSSGNSNTWWVDYQPKLSSPRFVLVVVTIIFPRMFGFLGHLCLSFMNFQKFSKLNYSTVEIRILSNHGNPVYTALYRVEIHGITGKPWFLPADILYNDEDPCEVIRDEDFIPYQFNLLLLFTFMASLRAIHVTYLGAN
jgi:hypothetical protein